MFIAAWMHVMNLRHLTNTIGNTVKDVEMKHVNRGACEGDEVRHCWCVGTMDRNSTYTCNLE